VGVYASLQLDCEAKPEAIRKLAIATLDAFFDPLTGGPDGGGWPIGRTVYRNEVMALLANMNGVVRVTGLGLQTGCDPVRCNNVELCQHELVVPGRHHLQMITNLSQELKRSKAHECEPC
jgi:hypothetical protein